MTGSFILMKIAIPTFGTRVSPRFDCAQSVLIVTIDNGKAVKRQEYAASDWTPRERIKKLLELGVDTIVCGGVDQWSIGALRSAGATVYCWVAGEAETSLAALLRGDLDAQAAMEDRDGCHCRRLAGNGNKDTKPPDHRRGNKSREGRRGCGGRDGSGRPVNNSRENNFISRGETSMSPSDQCTNNVCVIAIPIAGGRLCMHFGHCEQFALLDVDTAEKKLLDSRNIDPPAHEPGLLPRWLHEQGANMVIAGGMGQRAQDIFAEQGINVIVGAPAETPDSLVRSYLDGTLQSGNNTCDH
jgi:predicted Fe-Mo cluster-binding NifX family protein